MFPTPEKRKGPELMDLPPETYSLEELDASLSDLRVVNRYLGDQRALLKHLAAKVGDRTSFTLLDIATGSADLPVAIVDWARKAGISAAVTGVDLNERTVAIAGSHTAGYPEITLQVADGLSLPFPDKSFDIVICCKTSHHLTNQEVVRLIKEMLRVAKRGYILMDLRRSWIPFALIYLLTRIFIRNRLTRHDGPLSVLRSFTTTELAALSKMAGGERFSVSKEPFWLLVLSGDVQ